MKKMIIAAAILLLVGGAVFLFAPAIIHHHGKAPRVYDISNLHQIGLACRMFAADHAGRFPDNWTELDPYVTGHSKLFVMAKNRRAAGSMTNVLEWTDYVYLPGATTASPTYRVVAFLPPGSHEKTTGAVVLFADGHVESQTLADFTRAMNRSPNQAPQDTAHKFADPGR
jgi:prepilin-type processing-associated H-X9-DG protein